MDKLQHFLICLLASLYSTELALGAAITKEWCDHAVYGANTKTESAKDFLADTLGILLGTAIRIMIIRRWNWIT